jgi:hypothetical protein
MDRNRDLLEHGELSRIVPCRYTAGYVPSRRLVPTSLPAVTAYLESQGGKHPAVPILATGHARMNTVIVAHVFPSGYIQVRVLIRLVHGVVLLIFSLYSIRLSSDFISLVCIQASQKGKPI